MITNVIAMHLVEHRFEIVLLVLLILLVFNIMVEPDVDILSKNIHPIPSIDADLLPIFPTTGAHCQNG